MANVRDKAIKDIVDIKKLEDIISSCKICHIGMVDVDRPYVLAFNFGYEDQTVWIHCVKEGKKFDQFMTEASAAWQRKAGKNKAQGQLSY